MLTKILKNLKIIETSIFVYENQFIMILICLMNQHGNCFKEINENWFKTYVIFRNFDWIIRTWKNFVKSTCIKRLNRIIFTNKRWIKSTERKSKTIRFFFAVVKRKIELLQKLSNSVSSIAVVNQRSAVFDKNQCIASIADQRQHQIVQNLKNQSTKNFNIIFQQFQNVRQQFPIQHQSLFYWFEKNTRNLNFSLSKQKIFTNLSSTNQSIINISISIQQEHQKYIFLNAQSTNFFQIQFMNQI